MVLRSVGLQDNINFTFEGKTGNTFNSHRLIAYARTFGNRMENKVVEEIFKAYFER